MPTSRAKKHSIFAELETTARPQKAVLIFSTNGAKETLNAAKNYTLRSSLRKEGVVVKVVKNTIIKHLYPTVPKLTGQSYLAYLENAENSSEVTVPKTVVKLIGSKKSEFVTNFQVLGAVVNGEFLDAKQTIILSDTPSKEDSMAMIAGALNQITTKIAIAVKEVSAGLARSVQAVAETK